MFPWPVIRLRESLEKSCQNISLSPLTVTLIQSIVETANTEAKTPFIVTPGHVLRRLRRSRPFINVKISKEWSLG